MDSIDVYLAKKRKRREFFNQSAKRAKVKKCFLSNVEVNNNNYYMPLINLTHQIMINYFIYNEVKQTFTRSDYGQLVSGFDILAHAQKSTCLGL